MPEPQTVWEGPVEELASGGRVVVRATVFQAGGEDRSAAVLTIVVPDGFHEPLPGDSVSATVLLVAEEATSLAQTLLDAAEAASRAAPPLYE